MLSFQSGSPSGDEMENLMVKFSWMRESKDMIVVVVDNLFQIVNDEAFLSQ